MKSIWNHISITSHEICLNYIQNYCQLHTSFIWSSYELLTNFIWNEIKFIHSREVHMNLVWSSNELLMNFIWNEIKLIHMNLHAVRMKFIWTSYRRTNEVNVLYPCNTNEVDMRLINSSHEIHMEFIWISNDLNFIWTSCELHKNYMTSAKEVRLYYIWIWFLASLLCTSYECASRSIVLFICKFWTPQKDMHLIANNFFLCNYCKNVALLGWLVWYACPFQQRGSLVRMIFWQRHAL